MSKSLYQFDYEINLPESCGLIGNFPANLLYK